MATFRSFTDIVISYIEYLRLVQGSLDTKPGTVARDLFIDAPAQEIANLYSEMRNVSNLQSMFSASGSDLVRLASNFGVTKATGTAAIGVATLTTNNMDVDILIPQGSIFTASNGITFKSTENVLMSSSSANVYRANASRVRSDLVIAGITDEFAVDVNVESSITGTGGNIGRFTLTTHNIDGISNITNLNTFSGGTGTESDSAFRNRILSIFAGSNTGTALGYETALSVLSGVQDSIVIVPGDPLLVRDGTTVTVDSSGNTIVSDPGTGGKVDIYVLGSSLQSEIDSFIYNDQSGKDDPTDTDNDVILGQGTDVDTTKNVAQRRVEALATDGTVPNQPIYSIVSVAGSSSGTNFIEQYTDSAGQVRGNFKLVKDTGDYGGSPFGFDKLHWISNQIELDDEETSKGQFNGIDALDFSDVERVRTITQDVAITNENPTVSASDRSLVYLTLTPVRTTNRVTNLTTGERYVIANQNPDGTTGALNTTGKIKISGSTLPTATDILQVDYTWVKEFDRNLDFDNLEDVYVERTTQDSIDWGFGNFVKNEPSTVVDDGYGNLSVTVTHNVSKVGSVNRFSSETVTPLDDIVVLSFDVTNVIDMKRVSDDAEVYNTDASDGTLTGTESVILPTDTLANDGESILVRYNAVDLFSPDGYDLGTYSGKIINLPIGSSYNGQNVLVNYIADVWTLLPENNIDNLPALKYNNQFSINDTTVGEQPTSNILSGTTITQNLRRAASNIKVIINSMPSSGTITIAGATIKKLSDVLVTATSGSGLVVDLSSAIKEDLGTTTLGSTIKVIRLVSLERVDLNAYDQVSAVDTDYDVINYGTLDNSYDLDVALTNSSLTATQISLPATTINSGSPLITGDILRVTFYYMNTANSEVLYFSRNGTQITENAYSSISRVASNFGFKNAAGSTIGTVMVQNFNQPLSNTSYDVDYDYLAPKENERITITFNHNKLISDATTAIENVRPITADVLIKEAIARDLDATIRTVLLSEYANQSQTVVENARDSITTFLNANSLGTTIDASDLVDNLYSVAGIDRVRVLSFGFSGEGNVLSVTAERNEYLRAKTVTIEVETR